MKKILVIDDEINILELIRYNLEMENYEVVTLESGEDIISILSCQSFDLIILDIMLPNISGLEILKIIKGNGNFKRIPVICLSAKSEEMDKILGLELGADDYLSKPFGVRELIARVKVVLRRGDTESANSNLNSHASKVKIFDFLIDNQSYILFKRGVEVDLTLKEFQLFSYLVKNRGQVVTRDVLLDKIWGYDYAGETRTVDVHIRQLRKKIEDDDSNPYYIQTVRGVGYKFKKEE